LKAKGVSLFDLIGRLVKLPLQNSTNGEFCVQVWMLCVNQVDPLNILSEILLRRNDIIECSFGILKVHF
jgi:hypothetical protein